MIASPDVLMVCATDPYRLDRSIVRTSADDAPRMARMNCAMHMNASSLPVCSEHFAECNMQVFAFTWPESVRFDLTGRAFMRRRSLFTVAPNHFRSQRMVRRVSSVLRLAVLGRVAMGSNGP